MPVLCSCLNIDILVNLLTYKVLGDIIGIPAWGAGDHLSINDNSVLYLYLYLWFPNPEMTHRFIYEWILAFFVCAERLGKVHFKPQLPAHLPHLVPYPAGDPVGVFNRYDNTPPSCILDHFWEGKKEIIVNVDSHKKVMRR